MKSGGRSSASPFSAPAVLVAALGFVASFAATTQYIAHAFGYAAVLGKPLYGHAYEPLAAAIWLVNLDMRCVAIAHLRHFTCPARTMTFLLAAHQYMILCFAGTAAVVLPLAIVARIDTASRRTLRGRNVPAIFVSEDAPDPFHLTIGTSTGKLVALGHGAAIEPDQRVRLVGDEASQNIVVFGGTGSGKTSRSLNPMCAQALGQDCGILAFNVKGDWDQTFLELARRASRSVEVIGVGATPLNLLEDLTPETAASYIKSALLLAGNTSGDSAFWNELATELSRNVLGVLSYLPHHYTLTGLFKYLFMASFHDVIEAEINDVYEQLTQTAKDTHDALASASAEAACLRLQRYADYETAVFDTFDSKVKDGVRAQLSQILSLFTLPELEQSFCTPGDGSARLESVIDGAAFILSLPVQEFGLSAKTIYTFVKLRFFSVMNQRRIEPAWNQSRSVLFICDEYQEVVSIAKDALSDLNFWSLARSSKTVGLISGQGIESFRAAIGSQSLTDAFLQNFRQKICYATEDETTIKFFTYILGQVEIQRENTSRSKSRSSGSNSSSSSRSQTASVQRQMQSTINPQFFRQLRKGEVLAVLSIGGEACDDVVMTQPLYIDPSTAPQSQGTSVAS